MECSPPGSSVQGILQAGVMELVAISFSPEQLGQASTRIVTGTDPSQVSCFLKLGSGAFAHAFLPQL